MHSSALNDSVFSKIGRRVSRPPPWLLFMPFHALMYSNINYLNQFHTQTLMHSNIINFMIHVQKNLNSNYNEERF